jgi:hypothetical protein
MENTNEVMELSTQDLDTVAGGCHEYKDYSYEKREKKHQKYDYDCHKPRKGGYEYEKYEHGGCWGQKY